MGRSGKHADEGMVFAEGLGAHRFRAEKSVWLAIV